MMTDLTIGVAGLSCECCTFSPLLSGERDFAVSSGDDLLANFEFFSQYPDVAFIPLVRARALPGGSIEPTFYDQFKEQLLAGLAENGPWDGIFLAMHGAANVDGRDDVEGDMIAAVREVVGPDCLISASYDLHGNISQRVVDSLDILSAYRTAPHLDWLETLERSCELLVRCLREDLRPSLAFIPVPVLLPGEQTSTEFEPAASLYATIPQVIREHQLLDASILIGYVWADEPRATGSVVAVGLDAERTQAAAAQLAQNFWDVREEFQFGVPAGTVDQSIARAVEAAAQLEKNEPSRSGLAVISDSGDNPTAGGAGDTPYVLERLLALNVESALVAGIADEAAVVVCNQGDVGATVELSLGGKLDSIHSQPLAISGTVVSLHSVPWPANAQSASAQSNRIAVVKVQGVHVIITERRTPFHRLTNFTQLDLDPYDFQIVVVKMGYLVPELDEMASSAFLALSPGAVNQDIENLPYQRIQRPMFPMDRAFGWQPPAR